MSLAEVRRFTIVDGMILVAATAVGLVGMRENRVAASDLFAATNWWTYNQFENGVLFFTSTLPVVAAWTVALAILRLRPPRPSRRRLACQPGMVAACAVTGVLAVVAVVAVLVVLLYRLLWGRFYSPSEPGWAQACSLVLPSVLGLVVAASWTTLAIGRRWRAEAGWIDRLGRALGVFWIAMIPAMGWVVFLLAFD